jgi:hypothetical protein
VHADVLSVTFDGGWTSRHATSIGVIQVGEPFSGAATWDTGAAGALLSFSFTMPAAEGLSFASIPNSQLLSAGVSLTRRWGGHEDGADGRDAENGGSVNWVL